MNKTLILLLFCLLATCTIKAQHEQKYFPENDPLVLEKLEQWQDMKFGLLMHWGAYSQWGIVESWSICGEDEDWCRRNIPDYNQYLQKYENLPATFNPKDFNPDKWAKAAGNAGMKYMVFTTKHHDGFCMFDTKQTSYKITDPSCPFSTNPRANVTKEIFSAFRTQGFWTGAYFSKPDWHCPDYWWRNFPTPDRNVNYDIRRYPERWENYVQFTHKQIDELMTDYGKVDILWLDGGWVKKRSEEEVRQAILGPDFKFTREQSQDIRMDEIVINSRKKQPGLIVVDRAVEGKNQNYLTPENQVPKAALPFPWESCIIAGGGWAWVPDPHFKTVRETIHLLVDIVSKGGNLLLNIAPSPDGDWHPDAYKLLDGVGKWMKMNSQAIYGTRALEPYRKGQLCFTMKKAEKKIYAIYLNSDNEKSLPEALLLPQFEIGRGAKMSLLAFGQQLKWKKTKEGIIVQIPEEWRIKLKKEDAWVVEINL